MGTQKKSIDEIMERHVKLHNVPVDVTDSIPHEEFIRAASKPATGRKGNFLSGSFSAYIGTSSLFEERKVLRA